MKHFKLTILLAIAAMLLSSCGTQNKFASSFGKRRYTKGFYVDVPGNVQASKQKSFTQVSSLKVRPLQVLHASVEVPKPEIAIKPVKEISAISANKISNVLKSQVSVIKSKPVTSATVSSEPINESDGKSDSPFGEAALIIFIIAVLVALLSFIFLFAASANIGLFFLGLLGLLVAGILDLIAIILAFLSNGYEEKNTLGPKVVLFGNLALLLIYFILFL